MKIKTPSIILHTLLALLLAVFVSCDKKDEPAVPVARTVLVYQAANNNLGTQGYHTEDIEEMRTGMRTLGKTPGGRLLVYCAGPYNTPALLEIKATGVDTLKRYDSAVSSVSRQRMTEVIADSRRLAPAASYGLVLWSHGTGWVQDGIIDDEPKASSSTLSFGYERGKTMSITTLADILEQYRHDFVYFDCCYMMSVEVLYQLRRCTPVFVGSATELGVEGMPYQDNVPCFFAPEPQLQNAAANTFRFYDAKEREERTCTMSVVHSSALDSLAAVTRRIYSMSTEGLPVDYTPQRFSLGSQSSCLYFDYADYVRALCEMPDGTERFAGAHTLRRQFDAAFSAAVSYAVATPWLWDAVMLNRHHGMSTYIVRGPGAEASKRYSTLDWYGDVVSAFGFYTQPDTLSER